MSTEVQNIIICGAMRRTNGKGISRVKNEENRGEHWQKSQLKFEARASITSRSLANCHLNCWAGSRSLGLHLYYVDFEFEEQGGKNVQ
jgi:hypothetical protein